ncbi:MAG: hypothetical protein LBL46_01460, partial [Rickettsiales bacterium]|jgi:hypothetical protein|nr:hypothetical protein [Rickettsiales bacterium]
LSAFPDDIIITIDDDVVYPNNLVEQFMRAHEENPNDVISSRSRKIETMLSRNWALAEMPQDADFIYLINGVGGTLYPPKCLTHPDAADEKLFMNICPLEDDMWFTFMAILSGAKIRPIAIFTGTNDIQDILSWRINPNRLYVENGHLGMTNLQFSIMLGHYPQVRQILREKGCLQ